MPRCPERLGFNAISYLRCERRPGHEDRCWSRGWSWWSYGHDQDRRYKPSEPSPGDVISPWSPRRGRPAAGRQRGVRRNVPEPSGRRKVGTQNAGRASKPGRRSG